MDKKTDYYSLFIYLKNDTKSILCFNIKCIIIWNKLISIFNYQYFFKEYSIILFILYSIHNHIFINVLNWNLILFNHIYYRQYITFQQS